MAAWGIFDLVTVVPRVPRRTRVLATGSVKCEDRVARDIKSIIESRVETARGGGDESEKRDTILEDHGGTKTRGEPNRTE